MRNKHLPREFERLERLLASAPRPEPSAALRERVLGGVQVQLRRQRRSARWRSVLALAATLLLSLVPLWAAAHAASVALQGRAGEPSLQEVARRIQRLSPDIPPEEATRQAMLIRIAAETGCQGKLADGYGRVLACRVPGDTL